MSQPNDKAAERNEPQPAMVRHPTMGLMPAGVYARIATMEIMRQDMDPAEADEMERQMEIDAGK